MADIVVLGRLNMDLVVRADRMPSPGETLCGTRFSTLPGAKRGNQAAAVALLGGEVAMIGCVGDDVSGERLLQSLATFSADVAAVQRPPDVSNGVAAILVDAQGENRIIVVSGANDLFTPEILRSVEHYIGEARLEVLQLEVPLATVRAAMILCAARGIPVLITPAPAVPLEDGLLAHVTCLVLNETEARVLTAIGQADLESCKRASQDLRARGVGVVALVAQTCNREGASEPIGADVSRAGPIANPIEESPQYVRRQWPLV